MTPKFYFEGITFAIQDGARFVNARGEPFMERWVSDWGDEADVQLVSRAMIAEKQAGRAPVYLDMSRIPVEHREYYTTSKVKWMDLFLGKLGERARIDMFDKTEYFPMYQMTKMGLRTDPRCRASLPGLFAAGLAQAGCATHFAGFHIGMCNGSGWIAGRSAAESLSDTPEPRPEAGEMVLCRERIREKFDPSATAGSDEILKALQRLMFRYDITMLKEASRLTRSRGALDVLREQARALRAPDAHEWVRLHETECMLEAADLILDASQVRTETRMSHIREDFPVRDDANWLRQVVLRERNGRREITLPGIPTPLYPPPTPRPAPSSLSP
jgi:succinate dehydrogenase/fumarate reductase flavoprotein subunit